MEIIITFCVLLFITTVWFVIKAQKQIEKDWEDLEKFEQKVNTVTNREDALKILEELIDLSIRTSTNKFIRERINRIHYYLKGLLRENFEDK